MTQINMFEPKGEELSKLAFSTFAQASSFERQAELLTMRGFLAAARSYALKANELFESSFVFEMAAQFEIEVAL